MRIYIIIGETGEYADKCKWVSKAFTDQQLAKSYMNECQTYADSCDPNDWDERDNYKANSPDPHFDMDYTGTEYHINQHELVTDKFMETIIKG